MNDFTAAFGEAFGLIARLDADLFDIVGLSLQVSLAAVVCAAAIGLPLGAAEPEAVQAMRKILPELSSAEATAAIEAHDGSLREAMRSLLASL